MSNHSIATTKNISNDSIRVELEFSEDRDSPLFGVLQEYLSEVGRRDYAARLRALIFHTLLSRKLGVDSKSIAPSKIDGGFSGKELKSKPFDSPKAESNILDEIDRDDLAF